MREHGVFKEVCGWNQVWEEGTGRAELSWPGCLCPLPFLLKMLFPLAHLTPPFKVDLKFKLSLEAFFDSLLCYE